MTMSPRILAIIPARGGSKGLPGKNIIDLAGKPLLVHSIEHAQATPGVELVVVSTDDERIATVAREAGAAVVMRPPELSGDDSPSEAALLHALDQVSGKGERDPDFVLFLQATSPIRRCVDIAHALDCVVREEADSLFSASPQVGFVWSKRGRALEALTYDFRHRLRRQDLGGETIVENGSFYIFKPWVLRECGNRLGGVVACSRMGFLETLQVDDPEDLEMAEWVMRAIHQNGWPFRGPIEGDGEAEAESAGRRAGTALTGRTSE